MRALGIGVCAAVLLVVTGCAERPESSGSAGSVGAFAVRGQAVIAHPPGIRDASEQARREAAARCPDGFVIRSFKTSQPSTLAFTDHVINYDAMVECGAPGGR
jgi:hypothetical protein